MAWVVLKTNKHFFLQNVNGYNRAALAEAVFDVEHELFNEGKNDRPQNNKG